MVVVLLWQLVVLWASRFVIVQVDRIGLAIGPPARGRMGLAWVRARRRAESVRRRCMVALVGLCVNLGIGIGELVGRVVVVAVVVNKFKWLF